jgi:hypothetical protein
VGRQRRLAGIAAGWLIALACQASASGIYQWRDDQGKLHFGDRPPDSAVPENLSDRYNFSDNLDIVIEGMDYAVSPLLRDRLAISVRKIFAIYRQALELDYRDAREFRIVIYGDESAFRQYQQRIAPVLENAAGFYSSLNNQITTWAIPDQRILERLIVHEASHAISASQGRRIPTWLNEGLAEYFEIMQVQGLSAEIPLSRHWLATLTRHGYHQQPGRLAQTVAVPHQRWYAANGPDNLSYAASWALVWFLMDSAEGRVLIRQLLAGPHADEQSSLTIINRHWPGGFDALEQSWQQWLPRAQGRHRY